MEHPEENTRHNIHEQIFKKKWYDLFEFKKMGDEKQMISHLSFLDSRRMLKNEIVVLYRTADLKVIHVNSTVEKILGYTPEEYMEKGLFFKRGNTNKQPDFILKLIQYLNHFRALATSPAVTYINAYSGGVIHQHKDGSSRKFVGVYNIEKHQSNILPEIELCILNEATELFKDDSFWCYLQKRIEDKSYTRLYHNDKIDKHFVSKREKEILQLVGEGKLSKEIATTLNISLETVSQHRKNMIKRINAKDSSSLIQICKLCDVL